MCVCVCVCARARACIYESVRPMWFRLHVGISVGKAEHLALADD